jgi:glycosyltransferase involved in cell wall biosynthesis
MEHKNYPPLLPQEPKPAHATGKLHICLATTEILGPHRNGGVATFLTALAEDLARAGHEITVLLLWGRQSMDLTFDHWVEHYSARGICLEALPDGAEFPNVAGLLSDDGMARRYHTYLWLKSRRFDLIHFCDWGGFGAFCAIAKHQGIAFQNTALATGIHGPSEWTYRANGEAIDRLSQIVQISLERRLLELSDIVWAPSQYILNWAREAGYRLPAATFHHFNYLPDSPVTNGQDTDLASRFGPARELILFGRLEKRKGVVLFCDAMDLLSGAGIKDIVATFMGRACDIDGTDAETYIQSRAAEWTFPCQILSDFGRDEALDYLRQEGRLAVIAAPVDNSPCTVVETLQEGIAFVASDTGGIPELVAPESRSEILFAYRAESLAERLRAAIADGIPRAKFAANLSSIRNSWLAWHDAFTPPSRQTSDKRDNLPLVSLCYLPGIGEETRSTNRKLLDSLDYGKLEVIETEPLRNDAGPNSIIALRNKAAHQAKGEFLVFVDDDMTLAPNSVSLLVSAQMNTGSDIVSCICRISPANSDQAEGTATCHWVPLEPDLGLIAFTNCLGPFGGLIRRSTFLEFGGFEEDLDPDGAEWVFAVRCVLSGRRIDVVPEPLSTRCRPDRDRQTDSRLARQRAARLRVMELVGEKISPTILPALMFATSAFSKIAGEDRDSVLALAGFRDRARVERIWRSPYWRLTQWARNLRRRLRGLTPESFPRVRTEDEWGNILFAMLTSKSWELFAPLRLLGRLFNRQNGQNQRKKPDNQ